MKRNLLILILALLTCLTSFGQATKRERNLIKQGNEYFNKKQYSKAEESYSRVLEINPNSQIAKYNLGSTMLRQRGGNSEKRRGARLPDQPLSLRRGQQHVGASQSARSFILQPRQTCLRPSGLCQQRQLLQAVAEN